MSHASPASSPPPGFHEARNARQRVRAAGLDPDYWYAVALESELPRAGVLQVTFWRRRIALYRGEDDQVRALEDRCAHRQLALSGGEVSGCRLVCQYHGWAYDGSGAVVDIPHDLFGRDMPRLGVRSYPVRLRYGLVWLFPGDPERAADRHIPDIPELEGPDRWSCVPLSFVWQAHHSMIIDNVSDFSHAHLHRRYRPFVGATLTQLETRDDAVHLSYDTQVGRGRISGLFVDRQRVDTNRMDLCYQYPYQWSDTDGQIKHWLFVLPIDERTTRTFFLFYFKALKVPLLPLTIPRLAMTPLLRAANALLIAPLLGQDGDAVAAEQLGWERHWDAPVAELNPAVKAFQELTIRKWEEHLARTGSGAGPRRRRAEVAR
ncbi:MAG: aromatic ring-hydroxylating dioxygenase subunit alpha [Deltaproteobacteria bacterium]|nr:aromatic ring-hydroxylating dioxygenase subunit alpha [Deltaproteobacteria bacterium]